MTRLRYSVLDLITGNARTCEACALVTGSPYPPLAIVAGKCHFRACSPPLVYLTGERGPYLLIIPELGKVPEQLVVYLAFHLLQYVIRMHYKTHQPMPPRDQRNLLPPASGYNARKKGAPTGEAVRRVWLIAQVIGDLGGLERQLDNAAARKPLRRGSGRRSPICVAEPMP